MMTITAKRQVTFPKKLLDVLDAEKGDRIVAKVHEGKVILEPQKGNFMDLYGILKVPGEKPPKINKIIEEARKIQAEDIVKEGI